MRYLLFLFFLLSFISPALADCINPAGAESATRYDFAAHKLFYCNGTDWVEISGGGRGGTTGSNCSRGQGGVASGGSWNINGASAPAPPSGAGGYVPTVNIPGKGDAGDGGIGGSSAQNGKAGSPGFVYLEW